MKTRLSNFLVVLCMVTLNVFAADKQIFQFGKASSIAEIETKTNNVAIVAPTNGTPVNIDLKDFRRWMTNGLAPSNMVFTASNSLAAANLASSNALRTLTLTASNALRVDIDAGSGGGGGDVTRAGILNGSYPTGGKVRLIHAGVSTNSFTTITDAKNAAVAGDLVWVEAGSYYENNLLKSNVNYHFMPGVSIAWTNATDTEFGIFDDRATGTTTNTISGSADLYWRSPASTDFSYAGIMLTNSNTRFIASFGKIIGDSFSTTGEQPHIIHASGSNSWVSIKADELLTGSVNQSGQVLGGIVWFNGEMFVNISHIGEFAGYGIWPSDPLGRSTNNLWVTSDLMECYVYADAATLNFRSWYDIKELRMTTNGTVKSGFAFFGGRHYVKCDKISSPAYFGASGGDGLIFSITAGGEVWLDCQKLSRNGYSHTAIKVDSGTKLFANILHMEDVTTNTAPLIVNNGELWLSGVYYKGRAPLISAARTFTETFTRLSGVVAIATNDTAAIFADTNVTIVGSSLQTSIATNAIVFSGTATNSDPFPSQPFGVLYRTNFNGSVAFDGTYRAVTNWNFATLNGFTANIVTGQLTNSVPGWYRVDFRISIAATSGTSTGVRLAVFKNGIQSFLATSADLQFLLDTDVAPLADQKWYALSEVVWLPAGTAVDVRMALDSAMTEHLYSGRLIISKL